MLEIINYDVVHEFGLSADLEARINLEELQDIISLHGSDEAARILGELIINHIRENEE